MAKAGVRGYETRLGIGKAKNPFEKSGFSRLHFYRKAFYRRVQVIFRRRLVRSRDDLVQVNLAMSAHGPVLGMTYAF